MEIQSYVQNIKSEIQFKTMAQVLLPLAGTELLLKGVVLEMVMISQISYQVEKKQ